MQLIPAMDLRQGRVIRLLQGDDERRRQYDLNPRRVLEEYRDAGVERVHVVDLDAAFGEAAQRPLLEELLAIPGLPPLQLGGGLRDRQAIEWAFAAGCDRVVVTSLMARDFELFSELVRSYPGRIVPALDVDRGELRTAGWKESSGRSLSELCAALRPLQVPAVLVTDISRDGTMEGPNLDLARQLGSASGVPAILSGGVRSLEDLAAARRVPEIGAAIVGRALYDGALELLDALAACRGEGAA